MALSAADGRSSICRCSATRSVGARDARQHRRVVRPFVKRDNSVQTSGITRFRIPWPANSPLPNPASLSLFSREVYARGVVSSDLYERINNRTGGKLRVESSENGASTLATIDGSEMLSPAKAF